MSKIKIGDIEYKVQLNTMFIQPHFIINGFTTDIGIWKGTKKEEQDKLLVLAANCYEYNKKNETLRDNSGYMNKSEPISHLATVCGECKTELELDEPKELSFWGKVKNLFA